LPEDIVRAARWTAGVRIDLARLGAIARFFPCVYRKLKLGRSGGEAAKDGV